jgi:hypothetical protein
MAIVAIIEVRTVDLGEDGVVQHAEIEVSENGNTYAWRRGGIAAALDRTAIQSLLDGEAGKLFEAAQAKAQSADVFTNYQRLGLKLVVALALVVLDEINAIRSLLRQLNPAQANNPLLQDRTLVQLKAAVKTKLHSL